MNLSEKYRIVKDDSVIILQFFEKRTRVKKSGLKEEYEFTDNYYYPNLGTALKAYVGKEIAECSEVSDILVRLDELESKLINNK